MFKLRTNPVKAFNEMCVRLTSITFPGIWSSLLISVSRDWRYCGLVYKFFLINNIESVELKCSFVRCQKYHMIKWRRRASHLGGFTLWHDGRRATQLDKFTSHLGRFTLWHNGHRATQLGRFTLWRNGRRATQLGKFTLWHNGRLTNPGLMHASGVADILQSKI